MSGKCKKNQWIAGFTAGAAVVLLAVILFKWLDFPAATQQIAPAVQNTEETAVSLQSTEPAPEYTIPEATEALPTDFHNPNLVPRGNEGPVEYDLENINHSHKVNYQDNTLYYTFYPVLSGDAAGIDAINQDLYQIAQAFMAQKSPAEIQETHYAYGRQFCFSHTQAFAITHNGDGLISFRISEGGFWGNEEKGRYDIYYGRTYHLGTGQILSITDLVDMEPGMLEEQIRTVIATEYKNRSLNIDLDQNLDNFDLDTIPFWIGNGELFILLYDDPSSPYHTLGIGTGIYIS